MLICFQFHKQEITWSILFRCVPLRRHLNTSLLRYKNIHFFLPSDTIFFICWKNDEYNSDKNESIKKRKIMASNTYFEDKLSRSLVWLSRLKEGSSSQVSYSWILWGWYRHLTCLNCRKIIHPEINLHPFTSVPKTEVRIYSWHKLEIKESAKISEDYLFCFYVNFSDMNKIKNRYQTC